MKKDVTLEDLMEFMKSNLAAKSDLEDLATKEDLAEVESKLAEVESKLEAKIDGLGSKLGAFENNEVDKRKQLEVRVTRLEAKV